jgi:hypothetical protein
MAVNNESETKSGKDQPVAEAREDVEAPMKPAEIVVEAADKGQATSGYETLSLWQTAIKFKWASLYCFLAAMSAAADGYQLS